MLKRRSITKYKIGWKAKTLIIFLNDIIKANKLQSKCRILKKYSDSECESVFFKIEIPGLNFNIKLKAQDIANDDLLLSRFSEDEQYEIISHSGLCNYKLVDIIFHDNGTLFTVEASFKNNKCVKKFTAQELYASQQVFKNLKNQDKKMVLSMLKDSKIIPFRIEQN